MTGEEFRSQYQLGERLTEPPVVTHRAMDALGSPALVHYLLGSTEVTSASLLEKVHRADATVQDRIREIDEVDGVPVVVTKVLDDFTTFQGWLEETTAPTAATPEEEVDAPGAYTQLFKVSEPGLVADPPAPEPPPIEASAPPGPEPVGEPPVQPPAGPPRAAAPMPPEAAPPAPPAEEKKAPGSYTMLFGTGAAAGLEPPAPSEEDRAPEGGEPPPALPEAVPPAPPVEAKASEAVEPPPIPPEAAPPEAAPPAPPPEEKKAPGAYTQLFKAPEPAPPPPAPSGAPLGIPSPEAPVSPEASFSQETVGPPEAPSSATDLPDQASAQPDEAFPPLPVFPTPSAPPVPSSPGPGEPETGGPLQGTTERGTPPEAPSLPPQTSEAPPQAGGKKDEQPGAYTQIFGGVRPEGTSHREPPPTYRPPTPAPRPPTAPQHPGSQEPSSPEWQRWKDTPGASGRHIPSDDYLQRLSSVPEMDTGFPPPGSGQPQEPASGPLVSGPIFSGGGDVRDGPGHYTMVREGLSTDPGPIANAPQSAPPPGTDATSASTPKRRSPFLTILGLVVIVLAIVALVVAFALTS